MKYELSYDDENDVLLLATNGEPSNDDVAALFSAIDRLLEGKPRRYVLADLSRGTPSEKVDKETRRLYREYAKKAEVERAAIVGASPVLRIMTKIILAVMGRTSNASFFETREEAIKWLTEQRPD